LKFCLLRKLHSPTQYELIRVLTVWSQVLSTRRNHPCAFVFSRDGLAEVVVNKQRSRQVKVKKEHKKKIRWKRERGRGKIGNSCSAMMEDTPSERQEVRVFFFQDLNERAPLPWPAAHRSRRVATGSRREIVVLLRAFSVKRAVDSRLKRQRTGSDARKKPRFRRSGACSRARHRSSLTSAKRRFCLPSFPRSPFRGRRGESAGYRPAPSSRSSFIGSLLPKGLPRHLGLKAPDRGGIILEASSLLTLLIIIHSSLSLFTLYDTFALLHKHESEEY